MFQFRLLWNRGGYRGRQTINYLIQVTALCSPTMAYDLMTVKFWHPKATGIIQPTDKHVTASLKCCYEVNLQKTSPMKMTQLHCGKINCCRPCRVYLVHGLPWNQEHLFDHGRNIFQVLKKICMDFLTKKSGSQKLLVWCMLWGLKILKNGCKVIHVNWVSIIMH